MKQRELVVLAVALAVVILSAPSSAITIRVPLDQPTIQEGIDAASEGDTVLVAAGTYIGADNRNLDFGGTNMVVMSEADAAETTIDCEGIDVAFTLSSGEDSTSVIRGFTIANGSSGSTVNGGGIRIVCAAATIEDCIFSNNTASMNGGGLYYGYAPTAGVIRNCIFFGNSAPYRAGGIFCDRCDDPGMEPPAIRNCVFYDNNAGSGGELGGGAIFCNSSSPEISGCTLVRNAGGPGAGGIQGHWCSSVVTRTIIAFSTEGAGLVGAEADHCVIFGNAGGDLSGMSGENLNIDPLFCEMAIWDLTLCSNSPCLPGAPENTWGELVGAYESGCGDCDSPVEADSWGSIKAMYRRPE